MTSLCLATLVFVGIHLGVAGTRLRDVVAARSGEAGFRGLFSLAAVASLIWMIRSYARSPEIVVWTSPLWFRAPALVLMLLAFLLAAVGIITPTPTAAGSEALLIAEDSARGILRVTRHPFLSGVGLWSFTHLVANGDLASIVFFGGFFLLATVGAVQIDAKRARRYGSQWEPFARKTSALPFLAIAQGRNRLRFLEIGPARMAVAVALYALFVYLHEPLFGVSPLPPPH